MEILVDKFFYTKDKCKKNIDKLFIFGDNLGRVGLGGQAIIREEKNAIGLVTKKSISEYFQDEELEENMRLIKEDIERIKNYAEEYGFKSLVLPFYGLGTGLSSMQTVCPKTFCHLTLLLLDEWNFNNVAALRSK